MIAKLFTLFPLSGTQDLEMTMAAYLDETQSVPAAWLQRALGQLAREDGRRFAPSVGEIRGRAGRLYRREYRAVRGLPEYGPRDTGETIDVAKWLSRARVDPFPAALAEGSDGQRSLT